MKSYITFFVLTVISVFTLFTLSIAQPDTAQVWEKNGNNPIFNIVEGQNSTWNKIGVRSAMSVGHILYDGDEYKFYLGGYDGDNFSIGLVTSTELDSAWTWYSGNPVLTPGSSGTWDGHDVGSPMVIKDGDTYKMWYLGSPNANVNWKIGYATSSDGIVWEKHPDPVLEDVPRTWEESLSCMYVIRDGDSLKMWYADDGLGIRGMGYAVSADGINWTKFRDNPVIQSGPEKYDAGVITMPLVLFEDGYYKMWYMATTEIGDVPPWTTGFAYSNDGINWIKDKNNPVLSVGEPGQWDEDMAIIYHIFKANDCTYKILYLGSDWNEYHMGLASWNRCTAIETRSTKILSSFMLQQNFPNPFNPITIINYQLPMSNDVELSIYNLLGQKILTLVSERQNAGYHQVEWDAGGFASGVYYYQLKSGDFQDIRKMILLR